MARDDVKRFLTDEDVPVAWAHAINQVATIRELNLNWEATSIYDIDLTEKDDIDQLIFARSKGTVLVTCDQYRGQGGQELRAELRDHGGKIIRVTVGPQQPPHVAIAKLMIRSEQWTQRLKKEVGVAIITGVSGDLKFRTPEKFAGRLARIDTQQLVGYEASPLQPRQISKNNEIPDGQLPLRSNEPET